MPSPLATLQRLGLGLGLGLATLTLLSGCSACVDVSVTKIDSDGDGATNDIDCNDARADIYPGAEELCDGDDNDCDGEIDEGLAVTVHPDDDGDGYGDPERAQTDCDPDPSFIADGTDCDDARAEVHPGAEEVCDTLDNDCDGAVDEGLTTTWYPDADGDGFASADGAEEFCEPPGAGWQSEPGDCDDADPLIFPGAAEVCDDGIDQDCDDADTRCRIYGDLALDSDSDVAITGRQTGDEAGYALAITDDVDQDGTPELLIGAPSATCGGRDSGCAWLSQLDPGAVGVVPLTDTAGLGFVNRIIPQSVPGSDYGSVVASLGDLDQDGYAEFAVAGPMAFTTQLEGGVVDVFNGALVEGSSLDWSTMAIRIDPSTRYRRLASSLSATGDLSGDGYGDLLMATTASILVNNGNEGAIYILHACPEGMGGCIDGDLDGDVDVAAAWGGRLAYATAADGVLVGDLDARAGAATAAGFDFNGDGGLDIGVGAPGAGAGGEVYLLTSYPFVSSTLSNAAELTLGGEATGDEVGAALIAPGDLDQDGYDDLVIGAPGRDGGAGAAYVVLGRSDTDLSIIGRSMSLADADVLLTGDAAGDAFGASLSSGGDLNGDTFVELMVGAPGADPGSVLDAGSVRIFEGPPMTGSGMPVFANLDGIQEGGAVGASLAGGADLSADGADDLVIGAPGFGESGRVFVIYGGFRP